MQEISLAKYVYVEIFNFFDAKLEKKNNIFLLKYNQEVLREPQHLEGRDRSGAQGPL